MCGLRNSCEANIHQAMKSKELNVGNAHQYMQAGYYKCNTASHVSATVPVMQAIIHFSLMRSPLIKHGFCFQADKLLDNASSERNALVDTASRICALEGRVSPAVASVRIHSATKDLSAFPGSHVAYVI